MFEFLSLDQLVEMTDPANRDACRRLMTDHRALFRAAPGSGFNHQAWPGGYEDHVTEVMNLCRLQYAALAGTGRLNQLPPAEQFTQGDALTVLFLHDIEKPWRARYEDGRIVIDPNLRAKSARHAFTRRMLTEYGLRLTPLQENALRYVEGVRDQDYRPNDRVMSRLAALCHTCDLLSGRLFWDFPRR